MWWFRKRIKLSTGEIRFHVPVDGVLKPWDCDVTVIKLACESLERKHKLVEVNGRIEATEEFLLDLSAGLQQLGCEDCTPTIARQVWITIAEKFHGIDRAFRNELRRKL